MLDALMKNKAVTLTVTPAQDDATHFNCVVFVKGINSPLSLSFNASETDFAENEIRNYLEMASETISTISNLEKSKKGMQNQIDATKPKSTTSKVTAPKKAKPNSTAKAASNATNATKAASNAKEDKPAETKKDAKPSEAPKSDKLSVEDLLSQTLSLEEF